MRACELDLAHVPSVPPGVHEEEQDETRVPGDLERPVKRPAGTAAQQGRQSQEAEDPKQNEGDGGNRFASVGFLVGLHPRCEIRSATKNYFA